MLSEILEKMKNSVSTSDETLVGHKINNDIVVEGLLGDLIDEVMSLNLEIQTIKSPNPKLADSFKKK